MNMDEDLGSDSSDEDYVPSGGEGVSEEENSGDEEDLTLLDKDGQADTINAGKGKRSKTKKARKPLGPRKRVGGIKLDSDPDPESEKMAADNYNQQLAEQIKQEQELKKQEEEKKKADSLWSDFMKDVGGPKSKPKPVSGGLGSLCNVTKSTPKPATVTATPSTNTAKEDSNEKASKIAEPSRVTIVKEYDFAGEIVKVSKEVDANSKEAKSLSKTENTEKPSSAAGGILASLKRPAVGGGLGSVLGKIGKKPKMSTLVKSKLDWDNFKKDEGIDEELSTHNKGKDGYIERQQFLQRTDLRQFEIEKDLRNQTRKSFLK